ncbi:helix-turn-helix domain-containing protein [Croceitalea rosinachiae]|uniref:Helix-turn-helix domain-containing protein n=1 Tax=Croceitalea rosinachiae TaxID=3075596 RepID=A0ABU3A6N4_9FLAO|nr:helix-turn-helix domain-containing protein [Croceitalea sp. F388]MDT0605824.1 helix-turn-helix domain-containing protein [Croceitalea sp. F388]
MSWYDTFRNTKVNYYLVPLSLALAPLIYFYIISVTNPKKGFNRKHLLHFIPVLILIAIRAFILVYDANQIGFADTQNGYLVINFKWKFLDPVVTLTSTFQMLIYLVLSFQLLFNYKEKIQQYFSNTYKIELRWLRNFLVIYTILYVYHNVQNVIDETIVNLSWIQEWWYYLLSGLIIIYVGIKGFYTNLSALKGVEIGSFLKEEKRDSIQNLKQEVAPIELSEKLQCAKTDLEHYFASNRPFLEPDLTLVILANKLSISREELSETINKGFHLKFNDFINGYRIEEFKTKLSEGQHKQLSLIGIAYECGFNSKPTFNRAFKKATNKSPSEYLRTLM